MLFIIKVSSDKQHIESVVKELHRTRSQAYKWYKRCDDEGLEGLRNRPRSGKPSGVSKEIKDEMRYELFTESKIGWNIKKVEELIVGKSRIKFHFNHKYHILRRPGLTQKYQGKYMLIRIK